MPFSNDEHIPDDTAPKHASLVLAIAIGTYVLSLFNHCFCTTNGCRTSFAALLFGWLGLFAGTDAIAWLANPLLFIAWIMLDKGRRLAWLFALIAFILSLTFLASKTMFENEAGHYARITSLRAGYWLWVTSCFLTFTGSAFVRLGQAKNNRNPSN